jgi:hypothetical protein
MNLGAKLSEAMSMNLGAKLRNADARGDVHEPGCEAPGAKLRSQMVTVGRIRRAYRCLLPERQRGTEFSRGAP